MESREGREESGVVSRSEQQESDLVKTSIVEIEPLLERVSLHWMLSFGITLPTSKKLKEQVKNFWGSQSTDRQGAQFDLKQKVLLRIISSLRNFDAVFKIFTFLTNCVW